MSDAEVPVEAGGKRYPVVVSPGILGRLPELLRRYVAAHRYAVISDERVAGLYGGAVHAACAEAGMDARLFTFPPGEASKTRAEWARLTDELLAWGMGRDGAVVAVGGGVTGDLAGFVAATYMRGVPVAQVPTSLVAMIDASVGGKSGVDVPAGKNLVGAFHAPRVVVADPEVLATLPRAERAQGLAEAVKHGAILDEAYLMLLEGDAAALLDAEPEPLRRAVMRSVELKAGVVSEDEREHGLRQILNFGHTLGHAIEAAAGYRVGHGSAVAVGMIWEARLGERVGITQEGTAETLSRILGTFALGGLASSSLDAEDVLSFLGTDKKTRGGRPRFVLLRRPGEVHGEGGWSRTVPDEAVAEVVRRGLEEFR
ncbi:MAG: 3-dehydroquinate synthase [Gemmatimonadota bacterium]